MRARYLWGTPSRPFGRDGALKIETVRFGCQPLETSSAGVVVFVPIPRRRGDRQSGVVLIIRTYHWLAGCPVLSLMVELSSANRAISIG